MHYRTKPTQPRAVEAMRWTPPQHISRDREDYDDNAEYLDILRWLDGHAIEWWISKENHLMLPGYIARPGEWVIVDGLAIKVYDVLDFEQKFEPVP